MDYNIKPFKPTFNDQTQQDQNFGQININQFTTSKPEITTGGAMGLSYNKPTNPTYRNIMEQKAPVAMNPTTGMDWKDALNYATGQLSNKSWVNLGSGSRKGQAAAQEFGTILNASVKGFSAQQQAQTDYTTSDQKNKTLFGAWQNAANAGLNRINAKREVVKDRFNLGMDWLHEKVRHNRIVEQLAWGLMKQGKLPDNWQAILFPQQSNNGITMLPKLRGMSIGIEK